MQKISEKLTNFVLKKNIYLCSVKQNNIIYIKTIKKHNTMETKMIIVMRNDNTKDEIKPILILENAEDAHRIVETYTTIARITKRNVEYYVEYVPFIEC